MNIPVNPVLKTRFFVAGATLLIAGLLLLSVRGRAQGPVAQRTFKTPEAAVKELVAVTRSGTVEALFAVIGPEMKGMLSTGDPILDQKERSDFLRAAKNRIRIEDDPDDASRKVAYFGYSGWPFPAPLVKQGDQWRFDGAAGRDDIEARRIGGNEIDAILACRAYRVAQFEYAQEDHNGDGVLEFAQRLVSSPGQRDGLYWSQADDEPLSPLGYFFAQAGADAPTEGERHEGYEGYHFKILTTQGANVTGGAQSFLINGRLMGGFGLVAWPVEYGKTGMFTFMINQAGVIYQKDLGADTATAAAGISAFDPDSTWTSVTDDSSDEGGDADEDEEE